MATAVSRQASCRGLKIFLAEYIDGDLSPNDCAEMERHIRECKTCECVIDTLKKTIRLYKKMPPAKMSDEIHKHLLGVLRKNYPGSKAGCLKPPSSLKR
ncbi:MAG: zf-HC2 domain-containing protein [Acidobacteriia bacterium]|nr:zf-HC2 domain-containing protein [Terriglobia bacterium]